MIVPSNEQLNELFREVSQSLGFEYEEPKEPQKDETTKQMHKILATVKEAEAKSKSLKRAKEMEK